MRRLAGGNALRHVQSAAEFEFTKGRRQALAFVGMAALVTVGTPLSGAQAQSANDLMVGYLSDGTDIGDRLLSGESLRAGEYLSSPNGRYAALNRASDSLLVIFDRQDNVGVWSSGVYGKPGGRVVMRSDGLLVKYRAGAEIWDSGTVSREAVVLMQNNGLLVIYGKEEGRSGPIWANGSLLNPAAQAPVIAAAAASQPSSTGQPSSTSQPSGAGSDQPSSSSQPAQSDTWDPSSASGEMPSEPVPIEETVVVRGIRVHSSIAANLDALLAAAEADGIALAGWGWRSNEKQIELRKAHCGTSDWAINHMPSRDCSPPTARPGRSRHERGLAVDFTYEGTVISSRRSPAFQWLAAHASSYGLHNLPSEPWHWSVDGN